MGKPCTLVGAASGAALEGEMLRRMVDTLPWNWVTMAESSTPEALAARARMALWEGRPRHADGTRCDSQLRHGFCTCTLIDCMALRHPRGPCAR